MVSANIADAKCPTSGTPGRWGAVHGFQGLRGPRRGGRGAGIKKARIPGENARPGSTKIGVGRPIDRTRRLSLGRVAETTSVSLDQSMDTSRAEERRVG